MQSVFSVSNEPIKSRSPKKQRPVAQPERLVERRQQHQKTATRPSDLFNAPPPKPKLVPRVKTQEVKEMTLEEALIEVDRLVAAFYVSTIDLV